MPATCVLGLGNVLMGDDGFGPAAVHAFEAEYVAGPDVSVIDLGTPGLDLMPWLADVDHVIVVDTVKSDAPPGTMKVYDRAAVLRYPPADRIGPHDPGMKEALLALEFAGRQPRELTLIGVVPERTGTSTTMSAPVAAAVELAVEAIAHVLVQHGVPVVRRPQHEHVPPWWSAEPVDPCGSERSKSGC